MAAWLFDHGVRHFFHRPLVFFGDRTRFADFGRIEDLRPGKTMLRDDDVYILDFGPIVAGLACDVSVTGKVGEVPGLEDALAFLDELRKSIPLLILEHRGSATKVPQLIRARIEASGYKAVHRDSPYAFFGHRMNGTRNFPIANVLARMGKQTYGEFFARGIFGQLWLEGRDGPLQGLWAVEPHLATDRFGAKFEELLVVSNDRCEWLRDVDTTTK